MGSAATRSELAVARHVAPENFQTACWGEIDAAPYWRRGICFNPGCCAPFEPRRDWQMYCSKACERAGVSEMRRWGHRLALPSLIHRIGKYEAKDDAIRERTRAARRHIAQLQSAWLEERQTRAGQVRS
ncbi:hypothetical protein [uncultured Roseobacter sp.]|uniref:hypothetical protein n=1 Tax=uncultured Roseobacter sp. TaxID=114847 RepID=UPI002614846A|nr:hypothetical protein [uncultured Roseobacter sp.]